LLAAIHGNAEGTKKKGESGIGPSAGKSSNLEKFDSKFMIAPSWQLQSKLALSFHGTLPPLPCGFLGFVLWRTFFSLESGPDATRYA
jgi:hypothetical protein